MSYSIEIRLASKNGYHTPAEAKAYYGRYNRHGFTVHWWNTRENTPKNHHDNIVNYILGKASAGTGSVNYVLSDKKITMLVNPDNVAWASQSGNPVSVSCEFDPWLGAEGYKKGGWLIWQLEQRYNNRITLYPHNYWIGTQCPGIISLDKLRQELNKWKTGVYDPVPVPTPVPIPPLPTKPTITYERWKEGVVQYVFNKNANLWDFNAVTHNDMKIVKSYKKGDKFDVVGEAINKTVNSKYLMTSYSFGPGSPTHKDKYTPAYTTGVNAADLDVYIPPRPVPEPPKPDPEVPAPYKPDWETNLRDITDTKAWFNKDQKLIDITTGNPAFVNGNETLFTKDSPFEYSALTVSRGVEYRITEYSYTKGVFNGVPIDSLTLTEPGKPDVPPAPEIPTEPVDQVGLLKAILELLKKIVEFFGIK